MPQQPVKRFGDFAREVKPLDGSKVKIDEVINREILVVDFKVNHSRYEKKGAEECLTLQFEMDGTKHIFFTGSRVLIDQIQKYKHELPFATVIKKIDKYCTFT